MLRRMILSEAQFEKNRALAKRLQEVVAAMRPCVRNLRFVNAVFRYLTNTSSGFYSSDAVEKFYVGLAKSINVPLQTTFEKETCLLVTQCVSGTGGHSRVMERWIESDATRKYSIALLGEDAAHVDSQSRIAHAVRKSGGKIFKVEGPDCVSRGLSLRKSASAYESIVLFTFPWDVEHVIAFGTETFRRPVGFFNAPDHMFWLGSSLIDICADIRNFGQDITKKYRGITRSVIVPVPLSNHSLPTVSKEEARRILGINLDCKLLVSAARYIKYIPISDKEDYTSVVDGVLSARSDARVICIGARKEYFNDWESVSAKYADRFELKDYVPHRELLLYFRAADVVVGSYPMDGITTLEDAIFCDTPVVSLAKTFDFLIGSPALMDTKTMLMETTLRLMSDPLYAEAHAQVSRRILIESAGTESFKDGVSHFFEVLEKTEHRVKPFESVPSDFSMCEAIRFHESMNWIPSKEESFVIRIGRFRPIFAVKLIYLIYIWCLNHKLSIRIALYPLVVLTRPLRYRK